MRSGIGFLVAAMVVTVGNGDARAAGTARLVYLRGPSTEECPDEQGLRDAVAARLGYDAFSPWALDTLFAEIDMDGTAFVARMKLVTADNVVRGSRTIRASGSCSDLVPTLGLTISLALDPMALTRRGQPDGLPPSERPVAPIEGASEPDAPAPEPAARQAPVAAPAPSKPKALFAVGLGGLGSIGSAPALAVGGLFFLRAQFEAVSASLEARVELPSSTRGDAGGRVSSTLVAASLLWCAHNRSFFVCPRGTVGRLTAEGLEITSPGQTSTVWAEVGGRLGYELDMNRFLALRVAADAGGILTRYALRIGGEKIFEHPAIWGGGSAALVATFR